MIFLQIILLSLINNYVVKGLNPGVISCKVEYDCPGECIGLLLLTETDVSATCAVVIIQSQSGLCHVS